jgi:hypothetical protein
MKPLPLFLALASLAAALPARAQAPRCPPPGSGGSSTNWGQDYRERVTEIFNAAKSAAGVTQNVLLVNVNDLQTKNAGTRQVDGSPISALPKGTQGLPDDAIIYTFGVFEIACDEAQLATFMLHEMRHLKKVDGKSHFDRVSACRKKMFDDWACGTDLTAFPDDKAILAEFNKKKGAEVQTKCVLPVEQEADAFAFATLPKLPYKTNAGSDPNRDARAQSFKNAEAWSVAIGDSTSDPGHGCLADRAKAGAAAAEKELNEQRERAQRARLQSIDPGQFSPGN